MWKLNSTFPNNQWAKEEITRKFRKYFEMNENRQHTILMKHSEMIPAHMELLGRDKQQIQ